MSETIGGLPEDVQQLYVQHVAFSLHVVSQSGLTQFQGNVSEHPVLLGAVVPDDVRVKIALTEQRHLSVCKGKAFR